MQTGTIGTRELLQHFQLPGELGAPEQIYILGSFEQRVTLYSQQVRALNLVYALFKEDRIQSGSKVAVIGAGVSGVTAAMALAYRGVEVQLIEQADVLLPLQRNCRTRWVHPHIYDWPAPGSESPDAVLPIVSWSANYAHEVADILEKRFLDLRSRSDHRIQLTLSSSIKKMAGGSSPQISWEGESLGGTHVVKLNEKFAVVILAVGFGVESGTHELPSSSYWRNDDLDQPILGSHQKIRCLVSGNGDGGLIDLLRLRIRNFKLESLHGYLTKHLPPSRLEQLTFKLRAWESEIWKQTDSSRWLWNQYDTELDNLPPEFTSNFQQLLRGDTEVWLAAETPITSRSAILNRLWVALLVKYDRAATHWIESKTKKVAHQKSGMTVTFTPPRSKKELGTSIFERVVVRHGPKGVLTDRKLPKTHPLRWINDRATSLKSTNVLDQTRWRIWEDGYFGPDYQETPSTEPPSAEPPPTASPPPVTPRSAGSAMLAVQAQPTPPAPPAPDPGVPALEAEAGRAIVFVDHCRVDDASVRVAAADAGPVAPALRWHLTIQKALDLVLQTAERLDDLAISSPWYEKGQDRHINVPAFKQSFFDDLDKLMRAGQEIEQELAKLWSFLATAEPAMRAAALRTFAALASLRMIARLRNFEGSLRTADGRGIVNLFPDLPPIKSSWLLRRVPYRSRVGGLALGEERFLLGRVGPSASSYRYFLLPQETAERNQDDFTDLPQEVFFQWIVPQWFFQEYPQAPTGKQVLSVLSDEYGQERYVKSGRAPWEDAQELEEEPHPTISQGAELHELEPKWHVLALPLDSSTAPRRRVPMRPPLTGRKILWVDDHPENNTFEVSYLKELGASISSAISTELALSHIASNETHLIISDLARTENGQEHKQAGYELWQQVNGKIPMIFYIGDRTKALSEIAAMTADRPEHLYRLVKDQLRT